MQSKIKKPDESSSYKISFIIASLHEDVDLSITVNSCKNQIHIIREIICFIYDPKYELNNHKIITFLGDNFKIIKLYGKDRGIASAWNTALSYVTGEYIVFLGAGDYFFSNFSVFQLLNSTSAKKNEYSILVGMQFVLNKFNKLQPWGNHSIPQIVQLSKGMIIPHASSLWPRHLWNNGVLFNEEFKIALDYEFSLRVSYKTNIIWSYVPVSIIEPGGISNKPERMLQVIAEDFKARKINNIRNNWCISFNLINFKRLIRWTMEKLV